MLLYQLIITGVLAIPFGIALWNFFRFAKISPEERPVQLRPVSVLVPARNEETCIERCVTSLLRQDYPHYELIVLDDGSEDATGTILQKLAEQNKQLTVIPGSPLPEGWVGKNWACSRLADAASGELLIFTDADTVHSPRSISAAVAFGERNRLDFFSAVPRQEMETFWERVIIPMTQFLYFSYLPNVWITERRNPRFSAANGQFICMTRPAYQRIGGHGSVRSDLVEDVALGRAAKRAGLRTALAAAPDTIRCRMYHTLQEIISGFSKNLFPGFGYSLAVAGGFITSSILLYILPAGFAAAALLSGRLVSPDFLLPLLHLAMAALIRGMIARRFGMDARQMLYHPLSAAMAVLIALNSIRWAWSGKGAAWKGRNYHRASRSEVS